MLDRANIGNQPWYVKRIIPGVQNKKDKLDEWYQAYEKTFEAKEALERTFKAVTSELISAFADLGRTRWRKKSDFYSLFVVLARSGNLLPFSREGRQELQRVLVHFGAKVDEFITIPDMEDVAPKVKEYTLAVERAASDLGNRKERDRIIDSLLHDLVVREGAKGA